MNASTARNPDSASGSELAEAKQRTTEPYGSPPALKIGEIEITLTPTWGASGQVFVRQADPLPPSHLGDFRERML